MRLITKRTEFANLINELGLKRGIEIGVAKGEFSEYLLKNSSLDILYSVDAWSEDLKSMKAYRRRHDVKNVNLYYEDAKKRLSPFGKRSVIIKDISENAVKQFEKESLDFIYLDASHLFSGFAIDLINWWDKLKWDGIFSGHDFIRKSNYQVCYAISGFSLEHKQFYYITTDDNGHHGNVNPSWYLKKTNRNKGDWAKEFDQWKMTINDQSNILKSHLTLDIPYECL